MATAIIGLGNIGTQVSLNLMAGCQQVIVADHGPTKAMELANGSVGKARALSLADAVETAAIIIFAVYFDASKGLLAQYRDWLVG